MKNEWHLITSEYPPQIGGVSDYTRLVAIGLEAAGDDVHVWCPPVDEGPSDTPGVMVHRELGSIAPADLQRVGRMLDQFSGPRRLLIQWVPHGYGYKSINLPFCLWLWKRATFDRDHIEIMVHEPYLPFSFRSLKQSVAALVHRLMTVILLQAARRIWAPTPAWEACLRPYTLGRHVPFAWLPVPSNMPVVDDRAAVSAIRTRYAPANGFLVGHFGTYGRHIVEILSDSLPIFLRGHPNRSGLLMGKGSEATREALIRKYPDLSERVHATGPLAADDISRHLGACDVMVQPYPDGVSSRRTSIMTGLSHGLPVVTTTGPFTESIWARSGAISLAPTDDVAAMVASLERLFADETERNRMSSAARSFYHERFDVKHTIALLREVER